jgi:hypothetical protein
MTCGMRPETGGTAASRPEAARRWHTAHSWVPAITRSRRRSASRRGRPWAWVLAAGVVMAAAVRLPGAAGDVRAAVAHLGGLRLVWLGAAIAAEGASLASGAAAPGSYGSTAATVRAPAWGRGRCWLVGSPPRW